MGVGHLRHYNSSNEVFQLFSSLKGNGLSSGACVHLVHSQIKAQKSVPTKGDSNSRMMSSVLVALHYSGKSIVEQLVGKAHAVMAISMLVK